MNKLTSQEIELLRQAITNEFGGELLDLDQDSRKFTFAFEDQNNMLALIGAIKSDKNLSRLARINSKAVDGKNILTIDPS